jgi:hypothetical protein
MLGYTEDDVSEMLYGVSTATLLIDADQNPAIHRYLTDTVSFLEGILEEGRM